MISLGRDASKRGMLMRVIVILLYAIILSSFLFAGIAHADELSELKTQMKAMEERHQKEIAELKARIGGLEDTTQRPQKSTEDAEISVASQEFNVLSDARVKLTGSLWEYYLWQDNNWFLEGSKDRWLESIAKIGADITFTDNVQAQLHIIGEATTGDAADFTLVTSDDWTMELELANITYKDICDKPFSLTIGRQNLGYGDGFLIWDAVFDSKAVWVGAIRSFYALKASYYPEPLTVDVFVAEADRDYRSYETYLKDLTWYTGRRTLWGINSNLKTEKFGTWDLAVFSKDDKSSLKSDTTAVSLRGSYEFATNPTLTIGGEVVPEFGTTMAKDHALAITKQDRESIGGHIDATLSFNELKFAPFIKGRYIYLPGDDPDTASKNEAFDPMFYGWKDWGTWFMGSINSWNIANTNERVAMLEAGLYPTSTTMLRCQYFSTRLDREVTQNAGKDWSDEVNLIFDWFPNEYFFAGLELGLAAPNKAAKEHPGYGEEDTLEVVTWVGVQF